MLAILRYVAFRTLRLVTTILLVLIVAFVALRVSGTPIDAIFPEGIDQATIARLRAEMDIDRPLFDQFVTYLERLSRFDFGVSLISRRPVLDLYLDVVPRTLALGGLALATSILVSVPFGVRWALRPTAPLYVALGGISFVLYAVPHFVTGILLIFLFGYVLGWLPTIGSSTPLHYVLPAAALSLTSIAVLSRYVRSAVLDQMGEEYIKTAMAKGLRAGRVEMRHGLRNALVPIVTIIGMDVQHIVTGSMIIEAVFAWRGVGSVFIGAIGNHDYPLFQFGALFYAGIVVATNYLVDLAYVLLDPRIVVDA